MHSFGTYADPSAPARRRSELMREIFRAVPLCLVLLSGAARAAEPDLARPPDPRRGEALYVGSTRLFAGGAPCLGCHGVAGHGLSRAASFGPDLSGAHASFGADGLDAMLEEIAFPSMVPVYRGHAVTREERADLIAFLAQAPGAAPAQLGVGFQVGVAVAMGAFLVAIVLLGRRGRVRPARSVKAEGRPS